MKQEEAGKTGSADSSAPQYPNAKYAVNPDWVKQQSEEQPDSGAATQLQKLEEYLKRELIKQTYSFIIATHNYTDGNHWYVHPNNKSGETFDLYFNEELPPSTPQAGEVTAPFPGKMSFHEMLTNLFDVSFLSPEELDTISKAGEMYANGCLKQSGEVTVDPLGEWQLCPKCHGQGNISKPPHVAGDVYEWTDSSCVHLCDVCNGAKILARPFAASPSNAVPVSTDQEKMWQEIKEIFFKHYDVYNYPIQAIAEMQSKYHITRK